jgi:murein DD-endopeptidase MepM/ murein hydrolase activator NlpD
VQIILVDRRLAQARTVTLSRKTVALAAFGMAALVVLAVAGLYAVTFRLAAERNVPIVQSLVSLVMRDQVARNEQYVRDNVTAMAKMLGEMEARLLRLDALGERVSKLAGIRPEEFNFHELPGRGGAEPSVSRPLTMDELQSEAHRIGHGVEQRSDYMNVIESELVHTQARNALLPRDTPLSEGFVGSGFGMRTDPFTGELAMHAGVDFAAPVGTPIFAAAGGVVATAEVNPAFGKMVEIDHGHGLSTLYGHASRIFVKAGDFVRKGQKIAEVGTTGRSTGPHLHFEVHVNGVPQNPSKYLASLKPSSPLAGMAPSVARADTRAVAAPADAAPAPRKAVAVPAIAPAADGAAAANAGATVDAVAAAPAASAEASPPSQQ